MFSIEISEAVRLAVEICGLFLAIAFVLFCIVKMEQAFKSANDSIEAAKDLPGGLNYGPNKEDANEAELEKAWWQANA